MSKIQEPSAGGDTVIFGEGKQDEFRVTLQSLQGIYHELTGKSEEISKTYKEPFQLDFNAFVQLNHKMQQTCEQYNVKASNFSATIYFVDDSKEQFSSFERFRMFNAGSNAAVESILLTYNFLIVLPQLQRPQPYTLTVRVASPVAIQNKMREDMFHVPKIVRLMGGPRTAMVNIKYVDYVVARSVLHMVDEWFKSLSKDQTGTVWKWLQERSEYVRYTARYAAGLVAVAVVLQLAWMHLANTTTPKAVGIFLMAAFAAIFALYRIADHLGSICEDALDSWSQAGWICITEGDKKQVAQARARAKNSKILACVTGLTALAMSVASKVIATVIVAKFFTH